MTDYYQEDLAYVHDVGYRDYAAAAVPAILQQLAASRPGRVVELGCGSGWGAAAFVQAGYPVLGIDLSAPLLARARSRVPSAEFCQSSLFTAELPPCVAVVAIGECFNYLFDPQANLARLFSRVHQALAPGGLFMFDVAEPGILPPGHHRSFNLGPDWIVLVEQWEEAASRQLTRRIITLRQVAEHYRRQDEVHHLRLYVAEEVAARLQSVGFAVQLRPGYGSPLPGHRVIIARKSA